MATVYAFSGQETSLEGERAWWRSVSEIPGNSATHIKEVMATYVADWEERRWQVDGPHWSDDGEDIDLFVRPPKRVKNTAAISFNLAQSVSELRTETGWGGKQMERQE